MRQGAAILVNVLCYLTKSFCFVKHAQFQRWNQKMSTQQQLHILYTKLLKYIHIQSERVLNRMETLVCCCCGIIHSFQPVAGTASN